MSRPTFSVRSVKLPETIEKTLLESASLVSVSAANSRNAYLVALSTGEVFKCSPGACVSVKFAVESTGSFGGLMSAVGAGSWAKAVPVSQVFAATGDWLIATTTGENYYLFDQEVLAVTISKAKGHVVTAVAAANGEECLLGTQKGKIFSLVMDPVSKREKSWRLVGEAPERVTDLIGNVPGSTNSCWLVSSPTSLYSLDKSSGMLSVVLESPCSFFGARFSKEVLQQVSWLSGSAIVTMMRDTSVVVVLPHAASADGRMEQLVSRKISKQMEAGRFQPGNLFFVTPFHYVVQIGSKLAFVNKVKGGAAVFAIELTPFGRGPFVGIADDGKFFTERRMYEIQISNENGDDWKYLLRNRNFLAAANACVTAQQKALVFKAEGDFLVNSCGGDTGKAAELFAKAVETSPAAMAPYVTEIVGKLNGKNLLKFLLAKLEHVGKEASDHDESVKPIQVQVSVLFLYAAELFIDLLVAAANKTDDDDDDDDLEALFYSFVSESYASLNTECIKAVYELLGASGLFAELVVVAETVGDIDTAIQTDMALGNYISVIKRISAANPSPQLEEIIIKVSPVLFRIHPNELVDALIKQRKLFPAFKFLTSVICFAGALTDDHKDAVIRYLDIWLAGDMKDGGSAACQSELLRALVELKASRGLESELIALFESSSSTVCQSNYFDFDFALRSVVHHKLKRAELVLWSVCGLHLKAVDGALQIHDLELAKEAAWRSKSTTVRRLAWLKILTHMRLRCSVGELVKLFHEAEVLTVVDLMDAVQAKGVTTLDGIYDEIVTALNKIKNESTSISTDIQNYSDALGLIRSDISKRSSNRCVVLSHAQKCLLCLRLLYSEKFTVYDSCGHCFHTECLKEALTLKLVNAKNIDEALSRIDCCFCGDHSLLLEDMMLPFVDPSLDKAEIDRWTVRG